MPRFQSIPESERLERSKTSKFVTQTFTTAHADSYRVACAFLLKHGLYAKYGQFKSLWMRARLYNTAYIAYLSIYRRPVAVAFIERGYDFGYIMPKEAEGFIGCYVKPEYRNIGVATKLCGLVLEAGDFECVTAESRLKAAVTANNVRFVNC